MPTATLLEIDLTWTRRADPDPAIRVGESYDANRQYLHTSLRVGNVLLKMHSRERARRVLQNLSTVIHDALAVMDKHAPAAGVEEEDFVPFSEDETSSTIRRPKAAKPRGHASKK